MKLVITIIILLLCKVNFCQVLVPYKEIISSTKKSILPIVGKDPMFKNKLTHLGTAFAVYPHGKEKCIVFITCEHVVAIKDSVTGRTIRIIKELYVNLNSHDDSTVLRKLELIYSDEKNDYAFLQLKSEKYLKNEYLEIQGSTLDMLDDGINLSEGDHLLYSGYPLSFGVGKKSYPVSRTAIVAQNIGDSSKFLIDGFVQGGYSGSPVYRITGIQQSDEIVYTFKIIGILQAYPNDYIKLRNKKNLPDPELSIKVNPGFTIAFKMKLIIDKLKLAKCVDH